MRYQNPHFGQAMQGLGSALFGNPQAEGQAMLAKAQMDRQNQETVAREQLGDQIMNAVRRGTDPRQTQANIYGQSVRIGDNMAAIAPEFGRGAGMGIYGTEGMGVRGAADLHMGAGGQFQNTEMGVRQAQAAAAAQAAAERQAEMERARFEAAQPRVMEEGELMVGPDGQVILHAAPSEVLGPDERQTRLGPDGSLGVGVDAAEGVIDAQNRLTHSQAADYRGQAKLAASEAERAMAEIQAGAPEADVAATRAGARADLGDAALSHAEAHTRDANRVAGVPRHTAAAMAAEAERDQADAARIRAEADRTGMGNRFIEDNPHLMGDLLMGGGEPPANIGAGDGTVLQDDRTRNEAAEPFIDTLARNAEREGRLPVSAISGDFYDTIIERAQRMMNDPRGPSDGMDAIAMAFDQMLESGEFGSTRTDEFLPWERENQLTPAPQSDGADGGRSGNAGGVGYRILD